MIPAIIFLCVMRPIGQTKLIDTYEPVVSSITYANPETGRRHYNTRKPHKLCWLTERINEHACALMRTFATACDLVTFRSCSESVLLSSAGGGVMTRYTSSGLPQNSIYEQISGPV